MQQTEKLAQLYCTGCGYCMPCPQGVNIPARFEAMNTFKVYGLEEQARGAYRSIRRDEQKVEGKGECTACRECEKKCPQKIAIVAQLEETNAALGQS